MFYRKITTILFTLLFSIAVSTSALAQTQTKIQTKIQTQDQDDVSSSSSQDSSSSSTSQDSSSSSSSQDSSSSSTSQDSSSSSTSEDSSNSSSSQDSSSSSSSQDSSSSSTSQDSSSSSLPPLPPDPTTPLVDNNLAPVIESVSTSGTEHLRDVTITAIISDDDEIVSATLLWSFDSNNLSNTTSLTLDDTNSYIATIIPNTVGELFYKIEATDSYSAVGSSDLMSKQIKETTPLVPKSIKVKAVGDTYADIGWDIGLYSDSYIVEVTTQSSFDSAAELIFNVDGSEVDGGNVVGDRVLYHIEGLTPETLYRFRVAGICGETQGSFNGTPIEFTTVSQVDEPVSYPTYISASPSDIAQLQIAWGFSEGSVPDSLLIAICPNSSIYSPIDNVREYGESGSNFYGANGVKLIACSGLLSSVDLVGLPYDTPLSISIYPFSSNSAVVNYKSDSEASLFNTFIPSENQTIGWINELHYNGSEGDKVDAFEVVLKNVEELDLAELFASSYNGGSGEITKSFSFTDSSVGDSSGEYSVIYIDTGSESHLQTGTDGLVLEYGGKVLDFIQWQGSDVPVVVPVEGSAVGVLPIAIPVQESSSTPFGTSLQLIGVGEIGIDLYWQQDVDNSWGSFNSGQSLLEQTITEWSGDRESSWDSSLFWSNGVPTSSSTVSIPEGLSVTIPLEAELKRLNIGSGALVYLESGALYNVPVYIEREVLPGEWNFIATPFKSFSAGGISVESGALYATTFQSGGWNPVVSDEVAVEFGSGLLVQTTDDDMISISGVISGGSESAPLYFSEGEESWNLIGNSLLEPIEWSLADKSLITGSAYLFRPEYGSYSVISPEGVSDPDLSPIVPPYTSYFVEATSSGNFPLASAAAPYAPSVKGSEYSGSENSNSFPIASLQLLSTDSRDSYIVALSSKWDNDFDERSDSRKLLYEGDTPQLYSSHSGEDVAIDCIGELPISLPISIVSGGIRSTSFQLETNSVFQRDGIRAILEDREVDKLYEITNGRRIPVVISGGDVVDRFVLHLFTGEIPSTLYIDKLEPLSTVKLVREDGAITIIMGEAVSGYVALYDMAGRTVDRYILDGDYECRLEAGMGIYILRYARDGAEPISYKVIIE